MKFNDTHSGIEIEDGVMLSDVKHVDVPLSRSHAANAIKAEHGDDYEMAEQLWRQALECCRPESEVFCGNRITTCHWLSSRRCLNIDALFRRLNY